MHTENSGKREKQRRSVCADKYNGNGRGAGRESSADGSEQRHNAGAVSHCPWLRPSHNIRRETAKSGRKEGWTKTKIILSELDVLFSVYVFNSAITTSAVILKDYNHPLFIHLSSYLHLCLFVFTCCGTNNCSVFISIYV